MTSLKYVACFSALILIGLALALAACSAESVGQSTGTKFTKVALQGPTSGRAGDTLIFTCRVSNCTSLGNDSVCQEILSGPLVVFYVEAPPPSDNQAQQVMLSDGQAQASFTFTNPGRYVVSAIANDRASETVVQIAPSQAQTQGVGETNNSSSGSPSDWLSAPVLAVIVFIILIIVAVFVILRRRH